MINIKIDGLNCFPSREAARLLKVGRNTMLKKLRLLGYLDSDNYPTADGKRLGLRWNEDIQSGASFCPGATYFSSEAVEKLYSVDFKEDKPKKLKIEQCELDLDKLIREA